MQATSPHRPSRLRPAPRLTLGLGLLFAGAALHAQGSITPIGGGGGGSGQAPPPISIEARHDVLDNLKQPWTNTGVVPYRPMAIVEEPGQLTLYVVNVHDTLVRVFRFPGGVDDYRVPWAPVSLAISGNTLFVVCGGTHALVALDRNTGDILGLVDLPFEPADILINDTGDEAYVSCPGDDVLAVVDISDPTDMSVTEVPIPAKHPAYLSFDDDGTVLIAPMISGNNSTIRRLGPNLTSEIVDLDDVSIAPSGGLPDEDCFRFDPATQGVTAVARRMGTDLFAQGVNPSTKKLWQLNFEANNKDPLLQSEPAIRGNIGFNRLTITTLPASGAAIADLPHDRVVYLDDSNQGTPFPTLEFADEYSVGLPTGLHFTSGGLALVTGLLTDNVVLLDSAGDRILEWNLYGGSGPGAFPAPEDRDLPRAVLTNPGNETMIFVYCWGTNLVKWYDATNVPATAPSLVAALDIGFDPTPEVVKKGRGLFYDGSRSMHNNASCASCHIDGRTDFLVWNLSDAPFDQKGPLVTQSLKDIERQMPFHWRGERKDLRAFNVAFDGLLGGTPLDETPGGEFDQFEAFVFSLKSPANPGQDERNILNDAIVQPNRQGVVGSAIQGKQDFREIISMGGAQTCIECHQLPSGTDGDMVFDALETNPTSTRLKPTAFNELWRKDQPLVSLEMVSAGGVLQTNTAPLLGSGVLRDGRQVDIETFVSGPMSGGFFTLTQQEEANIQAYLRQFPSGVAPAAHHAVWLAGEDQQAAARVSDFLIPQAIQGHSDLAAFGEYPLPGSGVTTPVNWAFDTGSGLFVPDSSAFSAVTFQDLWTATVAGDARHLFVGLPLGNARRAAIDYDGDQVVNQVELAQGSDPFTPVYADDGVDPTIANRTVHWVSTKSARLTFDTSEPAWSRVTVKPLGGTEELVETYPTLQMEHSLVLKGFLPSTPTIPSFGLSELINTYEVKLEVFDDAGMTSTETFHVDAGKFKDPAGAPYGFSVLDDLQLTNAVRNVAAGTLEVDFTARAVAKLGRDAATGANIPLPSRVFVAQVIVGDAVTGNFGVELPSGLSAATDFTLNAAPYTARTGPFVLTDITDANGEATVRVTIFNLSVGDEVTINPIACQLVDAATHDPTSTPELGSQHAPFFLIDHSFPDTPADLRRVSIVF